MDEPNYWCHACDRAISLVTEIESINCPICNGEFIEEISTATVDHHQETTDSDDALSLWTPILLGMMSNPRRRRRLRRFDLDDDEMYRDAVGDDNHHYRGGDGDSELDRELEAIMRRRRSSAAILHLLQGLRAGIRGGHEQMQGSALAGLIAESENAERELRGSDNPNNNNREHVILMNPFNQSIIIQGSYNSNTTTTTNSQHPIGSLGDYFIGPGLEMLIQHLAENDPNRYGTPPAQKDAVESLPNVIIQDSFQCSVCLEDFEIGSQAKEMPCKHRFHDGCILPWLELHSSCPVCRHQLPCDESKVDNNSNGNAGETSNSEEGGERNESARRSTVTLPWPFSSLFSSSSSSTSAPGSGSHSDEN